MNRDESERIVINILEKNVNNIEISEENMKEKLVDLGVDSLDVMLVIMDISEASGITISDDEAEALDTPEKIVQFITDK